MIRLCVLSEIKANAYVIEVVAQSVTHRNVRIDLTRRSIPTSGQVKPLPVGQKLEKREF